MVIVTVSLDLKVVILADLAKIKIVTGTQRQAFWIREKISQLKSFGF